MKMKIRHTFKPSIKVFVPLLLLVIILLFVTFQREAILTKIIQANVEPLFEKFFLEKLTFARIDEIIIQNIYFEKDVSSHKMSANISFLQIKFQIASSYDFMEWIDLINIEKPEFFFEEISTTNKEVHVDTLSGNFHVQDIQLPDIHIQYGQCSYNNHSIPLHGEFNDILIALSNTTNSTKQIEIQGILNAKWADHIDANDFRFKLSGELSPDQYQINQISLKNEGFDLTGHAILQSAKIDSEAIKGSIDFNGDFESLQKYFRYPLNSDFNISGRVIHKLNFSGNLQSVKWRLVQDVSDFYRGSFNVPNSHLVLSGDPSIVKTDTFNIQFLMGSLNSYFEVDPKTFDFKTNLKLKNIQFSKLYEMLYQDVVPVKGKIIADLYASGNLKNWDESQLQGQVDLLEQTYYGRAVPDNRINIIFKNNNLTCFSERPENNFAARFHLNQDSIDGDFSFHLNRLSTVGAWLNINELNGILNGSGKITGLIQSPNFILSANTNHLKWKHFNALAMNLICEKHGQMIALNVKPIKLDSLSILLSSSYDLNMKKGQILSQWRSIYNKENQQSDTMALQISQGLDENAWHLEVDTLFIKGESISYLLPKTNHIAGDFSAFGSIEKQKDDIQSQLYFQGKNIAIKTFELTFLKGKLILENQNLLIDNLMAKTDEGRLETTLKIHPFKWDAANKFDQLSCELFSHNFPVQFLNLIVEDPYIESGYITGKLYGERLTSDFPEVYGNLSLNDCMLNLNDGQNSLSLTKANILFDKQAFQLQNLKIPVHQNEFNAEGNFEYANKEIHCKNFTVNLNDHPIMAFNGHWRQDSLYLVTHLDQIQWKWFHSIIPALNWIDGFMDGQAIISGNLKYPNINGVLKLASIQINHKPSQQFWDKGYAHFKFQNHQISLDSLSISQKKQGYAEARGGIELKANQFNYNLHFKLNNLKWNKSNQYDLSLESGTIDAVGDITKGHVNGNLLLGKCVYRAPLEARKLLPFIRKIEKPASIPSDWMKNTSLNIRVADNNQLWIDNNVAKINCLSNLTIKGSLANPLFIGSINTKEGYALYLDRKFNIVYGIVNFQNSYQLDPILDLYAKSELKSYQTLSGNEYVVDLKMQGPLNGLQFNLSSNPALPPNQIISLLTLGATSNELTKNGSESRNSIAFSDALQDRALVLTGLQLSNIASNRLSQWSGLAEITVEGSLFQFNNTWSPHVLASKQITERIKLIYSSEIGKTNEQSIRLDYKLNDHWSIQGETDNKGDSGLDFKWNIIK